MVFALNLIPKVNRVSKHIHMDYSFSSLFFYFFVHFTIAASSVGHVASFNILFHHLLLPLGANDRKQRSIIQYCFRSSFGRPKFATGRLRRRKTKSELRKGCRIILHFLQGIQWRYRKGKLVESTLYETILTFVNLYSLDSIKFTYSPSYWCTTENLIKGV